MPYADHAGRERIGQRIAEARKARGLTQLQLAQRVPCSKSLIAQVERMLHRPIPAGTPAQRLADGYNLCLGAEQVDLSPIARRQQDDLARSGRVGDHPDVPEDVRRAFVTALEISPDWHLRMQAVWQRHTDAAVSKTVNLPADAGVEDVRRLYLDAWRAGVKGITVYRYGSKPKQVLTFLSEGEEGPVQVDADYAGGSACQVCD
jgi:transcriptional regulator with XRE-family HTH domain